MVSGGARIMAVDTGAARAGVMVDQTLADARALCPFLKARDYDPAGDVRDLEKLGHWCIRYSPRVATDASDGIIINITGASHLMGGEAKLADDLLQRLAGFGLNARIGIAKTIGAAWAVSHFGPSPVSIIGDTETASALAGLPLAALRVWSDISDRLGQVGLKTIGALIGKPRAPLAARYGEELITRLDQALGHRDETLPAIAPLPDYRTFRTFPEPLLLREQIHGCLTDLATPMAKLLREKSYGARRFSLVLYRVDGDVTSLSVRTSALTQQADVMVRLIGEKLAVVSDDHDPGCGFEMIVLNAYDTEIVTARQQQLDHRPGAGERSTFDMLIDRYGNRLGFENIGRFVPYHSHVPERSERLVSMAEAAEEVGATADWPDFVRHLQQGSSSGRPIALLPRPEPITALAEVPDGAPIRFDWRRVRHRVIKAEGPERIAPEWWGRLGHQVEPTRDYFRVEDMDGYRFWIFRHGLYERLEKPSWYMHGLFP